MVWTKYKKGNEGDSKIPQANYENQATSEAPARRGSIPLSVMSSIASKELQLKYDIIGI